jgi:hypothetical protein
MKRDSSVLPLDDRIDADTGLEKEPHTRWIVQKYDHKLPYPPCYRWITIHERDTEIEALRELAEYAEAPGGRYRIRKLVDPYRDQRDARPDCGACACHETD